MTSSANSGTWYQWTGVDATTASTGTVWTIWASSNTNATTSASSASIAADNNTIWYAWSDGQYRQVRAYTPAPETEQQRESRLAREAEAQRQAEERRKQEAEALQRAEDLLMMHLNAQQLKDWQREKFFEVMSQSGKRFRIRNQSSMNVDEFDPHGKVVAKHCIVPKVRVPLPDQLVAQKLMLECQEADFMRIANHSVN